jgi:biopolymer transport protein ExbB/TolQ
MNNKRAKSDGVLPGVAVGILVSAALAAARWALSGMALPEAIEWLPRAAQLLSGPEQWLCYIMFFAGLFMLRARLRSIRRGQDAFALGLLDSDGDAVLLPEDAKALRQRINQISSGRDVLLWRMMDAALRRARVNWSTGDVGEALSGILDIERLRMESESSMIRYVAWAIPSIGFLGTVRGLGFAMNALNMSAEADYLKNALPWLAMAFDTTLVALVLSMALMFVLHRVAKREDELCADALDYCQQHFLFRMRTTS